MVDIQTALLSIPLVSAASRRAANWIDLQWSILVGQLKEVAPIARGRLLDVGCGCCPFEHIFTPRVDQYVGLEHESTFERTAAGTTGRKPDLYYDGKRIPFDDASFDTVLSIQVLEHTPDPQTLLNEMARVLRNDGVLILSAPFCFRLHEEPHDYFRYSPHGLHTMCQRAGLEIADFRAQGSLWSVVGHKINSYLAFQLADLEAFTQSLGKLTHEGRQTKRARLTALPVVLPAMFFISAAARVLDRWAPDPTEALSYLVVAKRGST